MSDASIIGHPEERSDEGSRPRSATPSPALLTMHCTRCDYSLEGLPRDGKCPECVTSIDDRFLVLRGRSTLATDRGNSSIWPAFIWPLYMMSGVIFEKPLGTWIGLRLARFLPLAVMVIGTAMSLLIYTWLRWSAEGPPHELWLAADGYWIRSRVSLFQSKWARRLGTAVVATLVIAVIAQAFFVSALVGIFAAVAVSVVLLGIWAVRRALRWDCVRQVVPGYGAVYFLGWHGVESSEMISRGNDRRVLELKPLPSTFWTTHRNGADRFSLVCSDEVASQLERRVRDLICACHSKV